MIEEGKYIYCIIGADEERNFGPIGIGGKGNVVSTIGYEDLSAVISNFPMGKYVVSKENLIAHEKVIEEVMKDYIVLPTRFCTVASSAEEVRGLLRKRYTELKGLLKDLDGKIELGVKGFYKEMKQIFAEIVQENREIKTLRDKIGKSSSAVYKKKIRLGELVAEALKKKKKEETEKIIAPLKKISYDFRNNETRGDEMLINSAFLIDRAREKEFDNQMDELDAKYSQRIRFKYVGPTPPYNFVNLSLK